MKILKVLQVTLFIIFVSEAQANEDFPPHVATVEKLVNSFNAQNSNAMAKFVADDVQWLSIDEKNLFVEAQGKQDLIASMNAYFKSCPTCRSELSNIIYTKNRVSAVETASWQGSDGLSTQRALSVYEFSGDKIVRVYYFPAEK